MSALRMGLREGVGEILVFSLGLVPWAIATGIAMRASGLSVGESVAMNVLVFAATAQLGTLPLLVSEAPVWLILATAAILNLRFVIYSAAMAPAFHDQPWARRALGSYLLVDVVFLVQGPGLLQEQDAQRRWGRFLGAGLWCWGTWQIASLVGIVGASWVPAHWSLGFMGTIALLVLLVPMCRERVMLVTAVAAGASALLLRDLPLRTGVIAAVIVGLVAGYLFERRQQGGTRGQ